MTSKGELIALDATVTFDDNALFRHPDILTLRELRREVGNDAARFFYVMRSNDQHLV